MSTPNPLLARVASLERENTDLRAEVEEWRRKAAVRKAAYWNKSRSETA